MDRYESEKVMAMPKQGDTPLAEAKRVISGLNEAAQSHLKDAEINFQMAKERLKATEREAKTILGLVNILFPQDVPMNAEINYEAMAQEPRGFA